MKFHVGWRMLSHAHWTPVTSADQPIPIAVNTGMRTVFQSQDAAADTASQAGLIRFDQAQLMPKATAFHATTSASNTGRRTFSHTQTAAAPIADSAPITIDRKVSEWVQARYSPTPRATSAAMMMPMGLVRNATFSRFIAPENSPVAAAEL